MNVLQFPEQKFLNKLRNKVKHRDTEIEWPNVVVTTSNKKYQKSVSESSFTILANKKGSVNLFTNKKNLKICEQTFYICNPFESFCYEIDSEEIVETFNIHLNYNFYTRAQYVFFNSNERLLDNPFAYDTTYRYINQLHFRTSGFNQIIHFYKQAEEEAFLSKILFSCLILDLEERGRSIDIPVVKKSTKEELSKRMIFAKDYMYSNYSEPGLSVNFLSRLVSMSTFHFLRTFKSVYGISPYQYLRGIRIEKAKYLIRKTDMPINEIAYSVGFQEPTALFPILRKDLLKTPQNYRKEISNFK